MATEKKFQRYFVKKGALNLIVLATLVSAGAYVLFLWLEILFSADETTSATILMVFDVLKNIFLVALSVFLTSIISILCLERRNSNSTSMDTIVNDVLAADDFLDHMSSENQKRVREKLTGVTCAKQAEILDNVRESLFEERPQYYFEECSYSIRCTIEDDCICKHYIRKLRVRSYEKQCKVKNFVFAQMTNKEVANKPNLEMLSVRIGNRDLKPDEYEGGTKKNVSKPVLQQNHYDAVHVYKHKGALNFRNDKDTTIIIQYMTRVEPQDTNLCCRISEHCKKFNVKFFIESSDAYDVVGSAFGFIETAEDTPNNTRNGLTFEFDKWVFKKGGVCINFKKI